MRTKVKLAAAEEALERLLDAFERELLEATDEEIMEAARNLGLDPQMKSSAVFAGLTYPAKPQLHDFFDMDQFNKAMLKKPAGGDKLPTQSESDANSRPVAVSPVTQNFSKH